MDERIKDLNWHFMNVGIVILLLSVLYFVAVDCESNNSKATEKEEIITICPDTIITPPVYINVEFIYGGQLMKAAFVPVTDFPKRLDRSTEILKMQWAGNTNDLYHNVIYKYELKN